jgi:hypothetical protein
MRAVLTFVIAAALAVGGPAVTSLVVPALESAAQAQTARAKQPNRPAERKPAARRSAPRTPDSAPRANQFYHQQCTWEDPCRTRNDW